MYIEDCISTLFNYRRSPHMSSCGVEVGCLAYGMYLVVDDDGYGGARLVS